MFPTLNKEGHKVKKVSDIDEKTFRISVMKKYKQTCPVFCQLTDQNDKPAQLDLKFSFRNILRKVGEPFMIVDPKMNATLLGGQMLVEQAKH